MIIGALADAAFSKAIADRKRAIEITELVACRIVERQQTPKITATNFPAKIYQRVSSVTEARAMQRASRLRFDSQGLCEDDGVGNLGTTLDSELWVNPPASATTPTAGNISPIALDTPVLMPRPTCLPGDSIMRVARDQITHPKGFINMGHAIGLIAGVLTAFTGKDDASSAEALRGHIRAMKAERHHAAHSLDRRSVAE